MASVAKWCKEVSIALDNQSDNSIDGDDKSNKIINKSEVLLLTNQLIREIIDKYLVITLRAASVNFILLIKELSKYVDINDEEVEGIIKNITTYAINFIDNIVISFFELKLDAKYSKILSSVISYTVELLDSNCHHKDFCTVEIQKILNGIRRHIGKFRGSDISQSLISTFITIVSLSIKIALILENNQIASTLIKQISLDEVLPSEIQRGTATEFYYYCGCSFIQKMDLQKAYKALRSSLVYCPGKDLANKSKIFSKMIAIKLNENLYCNASLLDLYGLTHYRNIFLSILNGNLKLFNETVDKNEKQFYKDGTITLIQLAKKFAIQRLCKRVYDWFTFSIVSETYHIIDVRYFTIGFIVSMNDDTWTDYSSMETINLLISYGLIKGYVAWDAKKIVLSKSKPFT